jgi:hypothetical protein
MWGFQIEPGATRRRNFRRLASNRQNETGVKADTRRTMPSSGGDWLTTVSTGGDSAKSIAFTLFFTEL